MLLREWIVTAFVVGFLLSITIIAKLSEEASIAAIQSESKRARVVVTLKGAVKKPGDYSCEPGTPLKELLKRAGISPAADRKKVALKKVIYTSQTIEIPEKKRVLPRGKKISLEEK